MRQPSAHHVEGFFHGGAHLLALADRHLASNPQARASTVLALLRQEMTTLTLLAACPKSNTQGGGS